MMPLASPWTAVLQAPHARRVILVTIAPAGVTAGDRHLATQVSTWRFATHPDAVVSEAASSTTRMFQPWVTAWPSGIECRLNYEDRRAEIADATVYIGSGAQLMDALGDAVALNGMTARIDLWSDGVDLNDVIELVSGTIHDARRDAAGGVQFGLTDGAPDTVVLFPSGLLSRRAFPDAPDTIADIVSRQILFGPIAREAAWPIDARSDPTQSRRYYLCDTFVSDPPSSFFKGTTELRGADRPAVRPAIDDEGHEYTELLFARPVAQIQSDGGEALTVAGGIGRHSTNVIADLLDIGDYPLTSVARTLLLGQATIAGSALAVQLNTPTSILDIVLNRLLPQTTLVGTWWHGKIHCWDLAAEHAIVPLGIGTGLRDRIVDTVNESAVNRIFNDITIRCGTTPVCTVRRTAQMPGTTGSLLARSLTAHGLRVLRTNDQTEGIDASDLLVTVDANKNATGSPAGERLADVLVRLNALAHHTYTYNCEWYKGMLLRDLETDGLVTDANEGLSATPMRVTRWALPDATGPQISFQTVDADA